MEQATDYYSKHKIINNHPINNGLIQDTFTYRQYYHPAKKEYEEKIIQIQQSIKSDSIKSNKYRQIILRRVTIKNGVKSAIILLSLYGLYLTKQPLVNQLSLSYGMIAIVYSLDCRFSFILALIALVNIPILGTFGHQELSATIAVATFFLLAIGICQALIENIHEGYGNSKYYQTNYQKKKNKRRLAR
ncbi:MAG: hypothetical protein NVSMB46_06400 [Candidatus Saccharimonadales bacterium]